MAPPKDPTRERPTPSEVPDSPPAREEPERFPHEPRETPLNDPPPGRIGDPQGDEIGDPPPSPDPEVNQPPGEV